MHLLLESKVILIMSNALAELVVARLSQDANSENAKAMSAYMKDKFQFFGVKSDLRKLCVRDSLKQSAPLKTLKLQPDIKSLWHCSKREAQYVALDIYRKQIKQEPIEVIDFLQWLVVTHSWWDTVDSIASNLVGPIVTQYPELKKSHIMHWIDHENMWLRRTSIIFQLKYKTSVDESLLLKAIEANLKDKDFFIRKAIGWSLRQYSNFNPDFVREVVGAYPLSKLSEKEATKYL